jgi:hypothetical protein
MREFTDIISKVISGDTENGYAILTFFDIKDFSEELLLVFLTKMIEKNPSLKERPVNKSGSLVLEEDTEFNLLSQYAVIEDNKENFDNYIDKITNSIFSTPTRWFISYLIDKPNNNHRIYLKIDHLYGDGYKIIEILSSADASYVFSSKPSFERKKINIYDMLYYCIIGTLSLCIVNLRLFLETMHREFNRSVSKKVDYIKLKPFSLSQIKEVSNKHNISVNDFLYCLMIRTDKLYTKTEKDIIACSSINISNNNANNMAPIFYKISNSLANEKLFIDVHSTFNYYKYSLYIYLFHLIINTAGYAASPEFMKECYSYIIGRCDYVFSNIIGPRANNVENIHYLVNPKENEIVFNCISSNDNIHIIYSFRDDKIENKSHFEQCIYDAYESLIK